MLKLTTPAFAHEAEIPMRYTQEAENLSPELVFSGVPANARSLVLLSDDPDAPDPAAPKRIWLHWLVVNIPTETAGFAEGIRDYPQGCLVAVNDSGVRGWSGRGRPSDATVISSSFTLWIRCLTCRRTSRVHKPKPPCKDTSLKAPSPWAPICYRVIANRFRFSFANFCAKIVC